MNRMDLLKRDKVPDVLLSAIKTLVEGLENIERRLACLEERSDLGVASFLLLWDLLPNVRSNGALTREVADYTINEIIAYLETHGGQHCARLKRFVLALQNPDGGWE